MNMKVVVVFCIGVRPDFRIGHRYQKLTDKWIKSLTKSQSIIEHVAVFENDLSQLIQQLKRFDFLDISGRIDR
ncbi:unnamed protein product [Rotaria sp. Silwood1]|nr:unnamed protein product [Rotaria sp. Silwood1]CAF4879601.1 unnamed protein product [Rotaria sp. Silwood1]